MSFASQDNVISKSIMHRTSHSVKLGLLSGLILGFIDIYFGVLFTEMSISIYIGFLVTYIIACILLGIIVGVIINLTSKSSKSEAYHNGIYFVCLLFFYDYAIVNIKLNGWFNLLNVRAIFVNGLLLFAMITLTRLIHKVNEVRSQFSSIWEYLQITIMVFTFTAGLNYFILSWDSPPQSKLTALALLFSIIGIPFLVILIKKGFVTFFSILTKSDLKYKLLSVSTTILLILGTTYGMSRYDSDLLYYKNTNNEPNVSQVAIGKPNIIWIVLDTARKDHISCYGGDRKTTTNIDKFSNDGVLFNNYISVSPWTLPSHASMFTGMFPSKHGTHFSDDTQNGILGLCNPLAYENRALAEILTDHGFNTGAVVANRLISKETQIDQGFNFYRYWESSLFQSPENFFWGLILKHAGMLSLIHQRREFFRYNNYKLSSDINETALSWIKGNSAQPFFLFLNYGEPHYGVFNLPKSYDSLYGFNWSKWKKYSATDEDIKDIVLNKKSITPEQLQIQYDWLDCKMTYLDYQIGQLFNKLKKLKLYDNSMIILVSDHGDLFGEHDSFEHNYDLYYELINVPLIIKYPQYMNSKGVNDKFVQTVDLMPEVLKILDIPVPEGVQGQSISEVSHPVVSELFRGKNLIHTKNNPARYDRNLTAIYSPDGYKYIQSSNNNHELYYLPVDPFERQNIILQMITKATDLDHQLENWRQSFEPVKIADKKQLKSRKKLQDQLKSLGYIK